MGRIAGKITRQVTCLKLQTPCCIRQIEQKMLDKLDKESTTPATHITQFVCYLLLSSLSTKRS